MFDEKMIMIYRPKITAITNQLNIILQAYHLPLLSAEGIFFIFDS